MSRTERGARLAFERPVQAVVPGQFAVFYAGERVLGGGLIRKAEPAPRAGAAPQLEGAP